MAFEIENGVLVRYTEEEGVTEVVIPEGVTSIGERAFEYCSSQTSVTIPESVTSIGWRAFDGTLWLKNYPDDLVIINGILLKYKGTDAHVTIPEGVTEIGEGAFSWCSRLTSVTIPEGVTSIGKEAFYRCKSLTSVMIPEGVTSIERQTFYGCTSLTGVTIPEGVTSIGAGAFWECRRLTSVTIPESVNWIGDYAFDGCRSIRMFSITFTPKVFKDKDFTNAMQMLKTGDFSMKISTDIKYAVAVAFWMKTEDEAAEAFIRKNISRIMAFLIEHDNTDAIGKMLESGKFITKKNIDKFITCAIEHTQNGGNMEIQTMLMHYKSETIGYRDPAAHFKL